MFNPPRNLEAPIIVIGAGRSGTHLLERMLNAHPDILMYGETAFLLPRLWEEIWGKSPPMGINENRLGVNVYPGPDPTSFQETAAQRRALPEEVRDSERHRIGRLAGATVAEALGVPSDHGGLWGYREIWNGSAAFQHDWVPYDLAFPRAFWVQIIRNPFGFARSNAAWDGIPFTASYLKQRLSDWLAMVRWNRKRRSTGRYHELRYEDLIAGPAETLSPLLRRLGLSWHEACAAQLRDHAHRSANRPDFPIATLPPISGFSEAMEELGYDVPDLYRCLVRKPEGA